MGAERTENDRVAEPIDSAVSSPGAYLALGLLYTVAALPAIIAPQFVSPALHSDLQAGQGSCMHLRENDDMHCMPALPVANIS